MEAARFLIQPQHIIETIKIMSWNVNGVRTKLERSDVQSTMLEYDIISLNEVKTSLAVSFPGYVTYKSDVKVSAERGGTALLVKDYISKYVTSVDTSVEDQVWIQFCFAPKCLFGFCYIPPPDSEYYSHDSFASIQEKIKTSECQEVCITGDLNARFGLKVRDLLKTLEVPNRDYFSYPIVADDVRVPSENASILLNICKDANMVVFNNIKTHTKHFVSNKTYRKGNEWISELDTCALSPSVLNRVTECSVLRRESFPSDHSPIAITMSMPSTDIESLGIRAQHLGNHAVLCYDSNNNRHVKKPLKWNSVEKEVFLNKLNTFEIPTVIDNIDETINTASDTLYKSIGVSKSGSLEADVSSLGRWERLLENKDDFKL